MFTFGFLLSAFQLYAQDIHFSQLERSPLNLNPAEIGNFQADHRIIANYRSQWASVTVPYKTFSASYDNLQKSPFKIPGNIGLGLLINSDVAGDGDFGTLQIKLSGAYHYLYLLDSNLDISAGVNVAYNQHSINFNQLYFDNQYNGSYFDPNMQTNENFSGEAMKFIDFSIGFKTSYRIRNDLPIHFGLAFNHLNRPSQSFYGSKINTLDAKYNLYLALEYPLTKYWTIIPSTFYYNQASYDEFFYGLMLEKELNHISFRKINFGIVNRSSDAVVFRFGFIYEAFDVGLSYDYNYSSLRIASGGVGAFEISIIYLLHNPTKYKRMYNRQCPVFM